MLVRAHLLSVVLLILVSSAIPQASRPSHNALYAMALDAGISEMEKQWGSVDDSFAGRIRTNYKSLKVVANPDITEGLPTSFGPHHVEYLDPKALAEVYKRAGKEFAVLELHPAFSDRSDLKINISVSWYSFKHRRAQFAVSDWSDVIFAFDCAQQRFVVARVELGGI